MKKNEQAICVLMLMFLFFLVSGVFGHCWNSRLVSQEREVPCFDNFKNEIKDLVCIEEYSFFSNSKDINEFKCAFAEVYGLFYGMCIFCFIAVLMIMRGYEND